MLLLPTMLLQPPLDQDIGCVPVQLNLCSNTLDIHDITWTGRTAA